MTFLESFLPDDNARPSVTITIPKALRSDAVELFNEQPIPHPVWGKIVPKRDLLVVITNKLGDVEELADFAAFELIEPRKPSSKRRRDAAKTLLNKCQKLVHFETVENHYLAQYWC